MSTFSGCGGSSLGYQWAGGKVRLAVEWDDNAVETYRLNFPDTPIYHGDIGKLSVEECCRLADIEPGNLDILDGSPPCQGFSTAGKRDFGDDRNQLFREYVRLLNGLRPKVFVMENVSGMVKGKMKLIFAECLRELKAAGYKVKARLLNAMYYGVPQSRQRLIFVGVREDVDAEPGHPVPYSKEISIAEVWPEFTGKVVSFRKGRNDATHQYRSLNRVAPSLPKCGGHIELDGKRRTWPHHIAKRIASFPEGFRFAGTTADKHSRIGNSVPPKFMQAIAEHIRDNILDMGLEPELSNG